MGEEREGGGGEDRELSSRGRRGKGRIGEGGGRGRRGKGGRGEKRGNKGEGENKGRRR